jgi:N,N'-diacetyllegionaminate synthase
MPRCTIIAEAGVNHNGDPELAVRLIEAAAAAGADAVKFQSFSAERIVRAGTSTVGYQQQNSGDLDQFEMLRRLELPAGLVGRLVQRCAALGNIEFMSTPFDEVAADELVQLGMQRIKIPSGELTNLPFIAYLARKDLPLILSTGMGSTEEVAEAIAVIARTRAAIGALRPLAEMLTILHCTSNYPTAPGDVNLRAMVSMREQFKVPVGYSDHTAGVTVPIAAVALGAVVIEKHFTLDRTMRGPDHKASLEPGELADMVRQIRLVEQCLGDGAKVPRATELPTRELVRRSAVAARTIPAGAVVTEADIVLLRPGTGIAPRDLRRLLGQRTARAIAAGEMLAWSDLHS